MNRDEAREKIRRYLSYSGDCPLLVQHGDETLPSDVELEAVADKILDLIQYDTRPLEVKLDPELFQGALDAVLDRLRPRT